MVVRLLQLEENTESSWLAPFAKKKLEARVALQHHPWVRCGAQGRASGGGAARNGGFWARLCVSGSIGRTVQANFLARRALCDGIDENTASVAPLRSVSARAGAWHQGASLVDATCAPSAKCASVLWIQAVTAFDGLPRAAGGWRNSSKIAPRSHGVGSSGRQARQAGRRAGAYRVFQYHVLGARGILLAGPCRGTGQCEGLRCLSHRGDSTGVFSAHAYPPRPSLAARQIMCLAFHPGL